MIRRHSSFNPFASHPEAQPSKKTALLHVYAAKADLARTYYQLGVTYHAIGNVNRSQESLQQADRLLSELEAVKQIEQTLGHLSF
jgi:hypothetical protein